MFCGRVIQTSSTDASGVLDINLRHPRTHATGWNNWRYLFPVPMSTLDRYRRNSQAIDLETARIASFAKTLRDLRLNV